MELSEYQALAMRTQGEANAEHGLLLTALGICGEGGEFADLVKKHFYHGHALDREKAIKELGDVLWYVARGAEALGISLEDIAQKNVDKLRLRYPEGFSHEASRNRVDVKGA